MCGIGERFLLIAHPTTALSSFIKSTPLSILAAAFLRDFSYFFLGCAGFKEMRIGFDRALNRSYRFYVMISRLHSVTFTTLVILP